MKKYTKPSIKFAAFQSKTKVNAMTYTATSEIKLGGLNQDMMSTKLNPLKKS